jgi:hypothetical protein
MMQQGQRASVRMCDKDIKKINQGKAFDFDFFENFKKIMIFVKLKIHIFVGPDLVILLSPLCF